MIEVKEDIVSSCISCNDKFSPTREISIKKESNNDEVMVTFHLCYKCLNKLAKELVPYS